MESGGIAATMWESGSEKHSFSANRASETHKDAAIAAQEKLIDHLKTKKRSVWSRIGDILLGAGVIAILK